MPIYIASLSGCECTPVPDFVFRAEDMVSAVMHCQERLEELRCKAMEADIDTCRDLSIQEISEATFELLDDVGIENVVEVWKECVSS